MEILQYGYDKVSQVSQVSADHRVTVSYNTLLQYRVGPQSIENTIKY